MPSRRLHLKQSKTFKRILGDLHFLVASCGCLSRSRMMTLTGFVSFFIFPSTWLYIFWFFDATLNVNVYMYVKLIDDQFAFSIKSNGALFAQIQFHVVVRRLRPCFLRPLQCLLHVLLPQMLLLGCCRRQHTHTHTLSPRQTRKLPRFFHFELLRFYFCIFVFLSPAVSLYFCLFRAGL